VVWHWEQNADIIAEGDASRSIESRHSPSRPANCIKDNSSVKGTMLVTCKSLEAVPMAPSHLAIQAVWLALQYSRCRSHCE